LEVGGDLGVAVDIEREDLKGADGQEGVGGKGAVAEDERRRDVERVRLVSTRAEGLFNDGGGGGCRGGLFREAVRHSESKRPQRGARVGEGVEGNSAPRGSSVGDRNRGSPPVEGGSEASVPTSQGGEADGVGDGGAVVGEYGVSSESEQEVGVEPGGSSEPECGTEEKFEPTDGGMEGKLPGLAPSSGEEEAVIVADED
jgi:hypothetical protein